MGVAGRGWGLLGKMKAGAQRKPCHTLPCWSQHRAWGVWGSKPLTGPLAG